MLVLDKQVIDH